MSCARWMVAIFVLCAPTLVQADDTSVRRFAMVASANDGGGDRTQLLHAGADAETVVDVLEQLGGVQPEDVFALEQPSSLQLDAAFGSLERRLTKARTEGQRIELVVYYSGHSDARGLLLGEDRFPYSRLKARLGSMPADVRIAILDSCASGALTRLKGGARRPPFTIDASSQVRGTAIITSSSETEAAQESDQIGGSFFTHYLVSALRGAGDISGDGRVTLNEAYQHAFHETLARTENTLGGAQHPAYDIQLVGTGDVVMTDLRSISAGLRLAADLSGRVFIRDADGRLAVELRKVSGQVVDLGLAPGHYSVMVEQEGPRYRGEVSLALGAPSTLSLDGLDFVSPEVTALRGAPEAPEALERRPIDVGLFPPLSVNQPGDETLNHFSFGLGLGYGYVVEGAAIGIGASWLDARLKGLQYAVGFSHVDGTAEGVQYAVGFSNVGGSMTGVQSSVGFSHIGGSLRGVQSAVGFSYVQGDVTGAQLSAGLSFASGARVSGAQLTAGLNYANALSGLQLSAGGNIAQELEGLQLAPWNVVTRASRGAQLGTINYAPTTKLQLGVVNVVKRTEGPSIGLLNYAIEDGIIDAMVYSSDVALVGVGFELGTRHLYTGFGFTAGTWEDADALGFGPMFGGRLYLGSSWELNVEFGTLFIDDAQDFSDFELLSQARVRLAYELLDGVRLFAGPTANVLVELDDFGRDRHPLAPAYAARPGDGRVYVWPGAALGFQFF